MQLCFATNNAHKLAEIKALLGKTFALKTLKEIGCEEELPETTDTIEGNSRQKAEYVWEHFGVDCFADDSGLEITALNGAPGVHSAYYGGSRDFQGNIARVLEELKSESDRSARFKTVITLVVQGKVYQFEGIITGQLLKEQRGSQGFGYDPIFVPDGYERTFAEMSIEEKGKISHRSRAFAQLVDFLQTYSGE
ncbi:RdgB/HAM1 family non-canonical purine NTP pyrophosphatase [Runella salmonicolor]|uniref:dITP/XTP pyrophosphatase n=1 Tax=Runella salmonicolor TaxID=2950278 RepID=A0ABT1FUI0_9BACT|nr:RdgB/HAM1 family non-canonical purine NTP pyrophosphatase [Runella salmonicolor]MCP1385418.1 RdgB/HAM1 family non-canonical purine NTP pyrophosphatase [Runella salmonicolor]